jgi:hypothetical protein
MDTRRHVSITRPTSVAILGLLGSHVESQGNRDSTGCLNRGKSEEHAAMQREKD